LSSDRTVTDLGVQDDSNLRFNNHINLICSKAYSRIRMIFRGFASRNAELLVKAYKVYVLPLLEYCTVIWSPWQIGLINAIENVQRYFTRKLFWPVERPYYERLAILDMELLEIRRIKLDLYYCFKIINNLTCIDNTLYFTFDTRNIFAVRNYDDKLLVRCKPVNNNRSEHFYFNRCVPLWNSLSYDCRNVTCIRDFKLLLQCHDFSKFLKGHV
jgi:hypothetical protein